MERRADHLVKFLDRRRERLVQAVAVGRFHDDGVDLRRVGRRAQQRPAGVAEIAREQCPSLATALLDFEQDARRTENVPCVEEGDHDARRERNRLSVGGDAAEAVAGVERVERPVERRAVCGIWRPRIAPCPPACVLFLQMGGVEHNQAGEFACRAGGDDLAAKAALEKQGDAPAMVEMGVGQQQHIDRRRVEAEWRSVFVVELTAALKEAAVDEDALAAGFDEMARASDVAVGAVERNLHVALSFG